MVFGGIIKAITGAQAADDLRDGTTDAMGLIELFSRRARQNSDTGFDRAIRTISGAADRARGALEDGRRAVGRAVAPYERTGRRANSHLVNSARSGTRARRALEFETGLTGRQPEGYSGFERSPGQDFMREEGMRAIEASASARGGFSGNTMRDISEYTTGLAQQDYGNHVNRLLAMATQGQSAAGFLSGQGFNATQIRAQNEASTATNLANSFGAEGTAIGGLQQGRGATRAQTFLNQGATMVDLTAQRANADAAGKQAIGAGIGSSLNDAVAIGAFGLGGGFSGLGEMVGGMGAAGAGTGASTAFEDAFLARMGG